jgi:hypothetical protein
MRRLWFQIGAADKVAAYSCSIWPTTLFRRCSVVARPRGRDRTDRLGRHRRRGFGARQRVGRRPRLRQAGEPGVFASTGPYCSVEASSEEIHHSRNAASLIRRNLPFTGTNFTEKDDQRHVKKCRLANVLFNFALAQRRVTVRNEVSPSRRFS